MHYFLDADPGATKTHSLIAAETGRALGFAESGPGNHESVGCDAMFESMRTTIHKVALNASRSGASVVSFVVN